MDAWELTFPWVTSVLCEGTRVAFCRVCRKFLGVRRENLKRHQMTSLHINAMSLLQEGIVGSEDFGEKLAAAAQREAQKKSEDEYHMDTKRTAHLVDSSDSN